MFNRITRNPRHSQSSRSGSTGDTTVGNMNDQSQDTTSTTTINNTDYARRCKELMQLRNDLDAMGASSLLDLPRVVVIGSQSAGKSSLVEGVSGICVPRDAGTCTRCPMECVMHSTSGPWKCSISLREEGGTTTSFSPEVTDRASVELWLRRAQVASLCPHRPPSAFTTMSRDELKQTYDTDARMLKFTNNVVCLDLHDPDATDLSFVDLPGLIQNESQEAIDLVKDMVVSYIDRPNTLILVAMPITDDVENQQAARLAREADPEGLRTIGVVTKPDCLPPGAIDSRRRWKDIFLGRAHQLNHGYYCVRLPDDSERARQASRADSAAIAAQFFRDTKPWKDADMNQGRFGIPNLVSDVSRLLVELIERSLPLLKQQVQDLLDRCLDDINNLPPTITRDPQAEVFIRVNNFCREFADSVEARSQKHYVQGSRALYAQLKVDIRATTPDFRPYPNYAAHPTPLWPCDEDGDEALSAGSDTESILTDSLARPIDLTDVRDVIKRSTGWELPGHVPYEATRHLIERHVKLWHHPATRCFSNVFRALNAFMHGLQAEHFSRFRLLHEHVRGVTTKEMELRKTNTLVALEQLLAGESAPILTLNDHYYQATSKKWHSAYIQQWDRARSPPGPPCRASSSAARLPTPIPYADEIQVMANVRAYFQVAYKRIIDGIPLAIERDLNRALAVSLSDALVQSLFEGPEMVSRMKNLISEDPGIEQRRDELASRKGQLEEIRTRLEEFGRD